MITPRRWSPALLVSLACLAGPALSAPAQTVNWQEAVARLAQERERAVTCAGLLKRYGSAAAAPSRAAAFPPAGVGKIACRTGYSGARRPPPWEGTGTG
jgi:hypothetical protein